MDAFAADVEDDVITPALTAGVVAQDAEEEERGGEQGGGGNEEQAGPDQHQHHHQRAAPEIKAIDRSSVARICSGQVCLLGWLIVGGLCLLSSIPLTLPPSLPPSFPLYQVVIDLATAVKELVENALDAGATQVIMPNAGISPPSFQMHLTSLPPSPPSSPPPSSSIYRWR